MLIQFLLIIFSVFVINKAILSFTKRKISLGGLLFWLGLWIAISVVTLLPGTTLVLAKILGVSRGTDVAVYLAIALLFYLIFRIFIKLEKIESDITVIVKEIALRDKK